MRSAGEPLNPFLLQACIEESSEHILLSEETSQLGHGMSLAAVRVLNPKQALFRTNSTSSGGGDGDSPAAAAAAPEETPLPAALEHAASLSRRLASASLAAGNAGGGSGSSNSESDGGGAVVVVDERLYASAPDLTQLAAAAEADPHGSVGPAAADAEPVATVATAVATVDGAAAAVGAVMEMRDAAGSPAAAGVAADVDGGKPPKDAKIAKQVLAAISICSMSTLVSPSSSAAGLYRKWAARHDLAPADLRQESSCAGAEQPGADSGSGGARPRSQVVRHPAAAPAADAAPQALRAGAHQLRHRSADKQLMQV